MDSTHAVVIITYKRPKHLANCLTKVLAQSRPLDEIVVVDQSPDDLSRRVCEDMDSVRWINNRANAGNMTSSRNAGLRATKSDILSFIDDDSLPTRTWAAEVLACFGRHPDVGCVAGRVTEAGQPLREPLGKVTVGRISHSGLVEGNFDISVPEEIEVEHALGANMSFRRSVLERLGGFREDYPGTAMGEDTDVSLRVHRLGWRVYFAPAALVVHDSAPHVVGRRFDTRYQFYASSNYMLLYLRQYGWRSPQVRGHLLSPIRELHSDRRYLSRIVRTAVSVIGVAYGVWLKFSLDGTRRASDGTHIAPEPV